MLLRQRNYLLFSSIIFIFIMSCSAGDQARQIDNQNTQKKIITSNIDNSDKEERGYNFKFIGFDINIDDPVWDRRSYFKIYIDKVDAGRTTIGLESQKKTFESTIPNNRHLLVVEKWTLDEKKGKYIKLNNIEQPRPRYIYFDLPEGQTAVITLKNDPFKNKSVFHVDFE